MLIYLTINNKYTLCINGCLCALIAQLVRASVL